MADNGGNDHYKKLYALQKRLKGERLFIRQDKDIIRSLNENVNDTCKNVYHLAWATRQLWRNIERLLTGARVFPAECTQTSIDIENVVFEDASKHLGYQDAMYGEFLSGLRTNPRLVALMLNCVTRHGVDIGNLTKLILSCLYGSCLLKEDEQCVLKILKTLIEIQIMTSDNVFDYFCSPKSSLTGFTTVLRLYSEMLFTSKLYLTAALHGAVMQVIVDDSVFLDIDMNTILNRLPIKVIREKFGDPGTPKSNRKMLEYIEYQQNCLISLCNKFLKSLRDKIYCFPTSIRWILMELRLALKTKTNDDFKTNALLGHVLMNFFICPAIINPEPFGINSDAFVSEIARYNLVQVASILRSMALAELGMKDQKVQKLLAAFEPGVMISFVEAVLHGADKSDPLNEKEVVEGLHPNAALMTEKELKALIYFVKRTNDENNSDIKANGIEALLGLLPPLPRRWTKKTNSQPRSAISLPIAVQLNANPDLMKPAPIPRPNKLRGKKPKSMYSPGGTELKPALDADLSEPDEQPSLNEKEEYEIILKDLQDLIEPDEKVLVISFGIETEDTPGMLPEEKVLGIKSTIDQSTPVDSNDIENERERRASTMIQDAMKDLEGLQLHPPIQEDSSLMESASSSFFSELDSSVEITPLGTPLMGANESKIENFSPPPSNAKSSNSDLLIAFDGMETHEENEVLTPQRPNAVDVEPVQKLSLLDLSPVPNQGAFAFEDQGSDPFFQNKSATLNFKRDKLPLDAESKVASLDRKMAATQSSNRTSYVSTGSLLGGLNTMLQKPTASLKNSFGLNSQDPFEIEVVEEEKFDGNVEVAEDAMLNEGDLEGSDSNDERDACSNRSAGLSTDGNDSVFGDAEIVNLSPTEPSTTATRKSPTKGMISSVVDTKSDAMREMGKDLAEMEKRQRKKTSGAWFKGKIATGKEKMKTAKKRTKSDGQALRKHVQHRNERKLTQPQSELRINHQSETQESLVEFPAKSPADVSEEILSKYRNIPPMSAGLMEDNQSHEDNAAVKETEFDEDFKFEDAKRKLRIVLCMADRSNFPSGASSCVQLFMTFLQAQLAEAINLQDRSVVAQLHETLRSIRQLPSTSCEKLLDALQEDYKQRAPYIAYLSRSKQGLLASLSHLEQIRKKVERDRAICNKHFTATCVRLFLETPEKKREILQFSQKFEETGMVDEKSALLAEFLENIYTEMKSNPIWVSALTEQWMDAKVATERTIMSKIYKAAFRPNGLQDTENDKVFHEHINNLASFITVNHKSLQIPKVLQKEAPWPSAQTELLMINAYKTPADKLRCIHRCCIAIMNLLSMATPSQTSGADEFVPVLVYVLIRANPPNLLSTKQYITNFIDDRLGGEEMYCWTQFSAAIEFVKSLR